MPAAGELIIAMINPRIIGRVNNLERWQSSNDKNGRGARAPGKGELIVREPPPLFYARQAQPSDGGRHSRSSANIFL